MKNDLLEQKVDRLGVQMKEGFERIDDTLMQTNQAVEKIAIAVVSLQENVQTNTNRIERLEHAHDRAFGFMDEFLHTMKRQEAEIASGRSATDRLDQRVTVLEQK